MEVRYRERNRKLDSMTDLFKHGKHGIFIPLDEAK